MKKTLLILITALGLTSCVVEDSEKSSRTTQNLEYATRSLSYITAIYPAFMMDNCYRAHEYLNATDVERKSSKYAALGWYSSSESFKVDGLGEIFINGTDLTSTSARWNVVARDIKYSVKYLGDSKWEVTDDGKKSSYSALFTLVGKDIDDNCIWNCHTEGTYTEDDNWAGTISTDEKGMNFFWSGTNTGMSFSSIIKWSGTVTAVFSVKGKKTDWCTITYENGVTKNSITSH